MIEDRTSCAVFPPIVDDASLKVSIKYSSRFFVKSEILIVDKHLQFRVNVHCFHWTNWRTVDIVRFSNRHNLFIQYVHWKCPNWPLDMSIRSVGPMTKWLLVNLGILWILSTRHNEPNQNKPSWPNRPNGLGHNDKIDPVHKVDTLHTQWI